MLDHGEIRRLLAVQLQSGEPTEVEFCAFMNGANTNQNGVMSLNEYIAAMLSCKAFTVEG